MIKTILQRAKSTFSQPISQPEPAPEVAPEATPEAAPEPKPEAILKATPKTAKELSEQVAAQLGYEAGDSVKLKICRPQRARNDRLLFCEVISWPGKAQPWMAPVRCWVKDAASWLPASPPHDELEARYAGRASVDGDLEFESPAVSRKSRLLKNR